MTINYFASEPNRRPDTVYVCGSGECVQRISEAMVGMREPGDHEFGVLPATDLMPPCRSGGAGDGFEAHCAAAAGAAVQTWVRKESKACRERRERKERKERRT